jgi:hypothetical protein
MELLGDEAHMESCFGPLEMEFPLVQHRCMVSVKCTIGSEIILDAPNGTPR